MRRRGLAAYFPEGVKWTCIKCGRELETPARVVPKGNVCDLCSTGWSGPTPCALPEGQWCQFGWHHRVDIHGVKHVTTRCSRTIQRTHDEKAAEYLERMKRDGDKLGFKDFDESLQPGMYAEALRWAKECDGRDVVALIGEPGAGKSHLLNAARFYLLRRGLTVGWILPTELSRVVNAYRALGGLDDDELMWWESWAGSDVLCIDDLGKEVSPRDGTSGVLCDLLDERGPRPLAWASNLPRAEIEAQYDRALVSRLFHGAKVPRINPGDYRRRQCG